jgi:anaphase-promoting complex subunit 3
LERAIRLNHRFGYAYSLLGHELIDMNDLGRAEQAFRKAIVYAPNDYRAWYGLGLVNYKVGSFSFLYLKFKTFLNIFWIKKFCSQNFWPIG